MDDSYLSSQHKASSYHVFVSTSCPILKGKQDGQQLSSLWRIGANVLSVRLAERQADMRCLVKKGQRGQKLENNQM